MCRYGQKGGRVKGPGVLYLVTVPPLQLSHINCDVFRMFTLRAHNKMLHCLYKGWRQCQCGTWPNSPNNVDNYSQLSLMSSSSYTILTILLAFKTDSSANRGGHCTKSHKISGSKQFRLVITESVLIGNCYGAAAQCDADRLVTPRWLILTNWSQQGQGPVGGRVNNPHHTHGPFNYTCSNKYKYK